MFEGRGVGSKLPPAHRGIEYVAMLKNLFFADFRGLFCSFGGFLLRFFVMISSGVLFLFFTKTRSAENGVTCFVFQDHQKTNTHTPLAVPNNLLHTKKAEDLKRYSPLPRS